MRVIIVCDIEGLLYVFAVLGNLAFGFLKRLSDEVKWLHRADWENQVVLSDIIGIKRFELGFISNTIR